MGPSKDRSRSKVEFSTTSKAPLTVREWLPGIGFNKDFREKWCVRIVDLLSKPELRSDDVFCMQQSESLRFCLFAILSCLQSTHMNQWGQSLWVKEEKKFQLVFWRQEHLRTTRLECYCMCGFKCSMEKGWVGWVCCETMWKWGAVSYLQQVTTAMQSKMRHCGKSHVRDSPNPGEQGLTFRFQLDTIVLGTCSPAGRTGCCLFTPDASSSNIP